jgi:hypothetical protein
MRDIAACLKLGGRLLLTVPNYNYVPMTRGDLDPFSRIEDRGHVRRGYTRAMLVELCRDTGLDVEEVGSCTRVVSQKTTAAMRKIHPHMLAWALVFPLRLLPLLLDRVIAK